MSGIVYGIVIVAFIVAAIRHLGGFGAIGETSPMEALGQSMIEAAGSAVTLALGLVGVMALFLGLMKIAEKGGLLVIIARTLRPLMVRLFPDVPADHPAMGAMILNISANVLGLGNAATPFGIRAMQELDRLNPVKGTASNAMALFVAINTSSVTILPTGVVAVRAALGSHDPAGVVPTTLFATIVSTIVAIIAAKLLEKRFKVIAPKAASSATTGTMALDDTIGDPTDSSSPDALTLPALPEATRSYPVWVSMAALSSVVGLIPLMVFFGAAIAPWIIPCLMVGLMSFGLAKRVRLYDAFVEGAAEGFRVALRIIPYLVAILVAVAMFRSSGALDLIFGPIGAATEAIGLPAEGLIMAILRSLSGSGAYGYMASVLQDPAIGPDSYTGYLVTTIQGSTETTFYVLAVYFGAVQIRRVRHALAAGLIADIAGLAAAVLICWLLFGA
ncbi:MAG: spore maturation protein [Alphaproteobacteria bacterium]|nr:spore maturation protein [Alphaproteobacteria bacterium]